MGVEMKCTHWVGGGGTNRKGPKLLKELSIVEVAK